MADAGVVSYGAGAALFAVLSLLLASAWRGRLQGGLLLAASVVATLWCGLLAYHEAAGTPELRWLALSEIARDATWFAFLLALLGYGTKKASAPALRTSAWFVMGLCAVAAASILIEPYLAARIPGRGLAGNVTLLLNVLLAVTGLALVEQLYRNTDPEKRGAVSFLCLGVGGMFAYDLGLYSDALLFGSFSSVLWEGRGAVQALAVPFIAVSAARNPQWSVRVFVSRHVVFHSVTVLASGVYLAAVAVVGHYLRVQGGGWGSVVQVAFIFGALLFLLAFLSSGRLRSHVRVFLAKHFFMNKYEYREEWLRFTHALSRSEHDRELRENTVKAIAQMVGSPGGVMWVRVESGYFEPAASWNVLLPGDATLDADAALVRFLEERGWTICLDEHREHPARYSGLVLPEWLGRMGDPWIVVPLLQRDDLLGFVVLMRSQTLKSLNWEDTDLLKTVGREAASYLAVLNLSEALADARQFEAFNRLSAYVVHDLKNLVAQLSLVVSNARKHSDNPAFMQDVIDTVENATRRMNQLLGHLRKGRREEGSRWPVVLESVLREVREARSEHAPVPLLECTDDDIRVQVDRDRLAAVVTHLVQNAQEATPADGKVTMRLRREDGWALIEIEDSGVGMDKRFIAERLFRPFDTTKGNAGMGIGAYQSREFLRAQGGDIEVESGPGKGTVFRLRLPLCELGAFPARSSSAEAVG